MLHGAQGNSDVAASCLLSLFERVDPDDPTPHQVAALHILATMAADLHALVRAWTE